jgi:hypothetical protein
LENRARCWTVTSSSCRTPLVAHHGVRRQRTPGGRSSSTSFLTNAAEGSTGCGNGLSPWGIAEGR